MYYCSMKTTDSTHEDIFQDWLDEAIAANIVTVQIKHPLPRYELCPQVKVPYTKHLITKQKEITRELLKPWTYTPDFIFYWNSNYLGKLFVPYNKRSSIDSKHAFFLANKDVTGAYFSIVDVKASINRFGRRDSDVIFPLAQKQLYNIKRLYVQKTVVIPLTKDDPFSTLLGATWVPQNYKSELYYKRDYKRDGVVLKREGDCKVPWEIRSVINFI